MNAQWRKFAFFDKSLVTQPGTNEPHQFLNTLDITCSTSGRGQLIFGDSSGYIHLVDRSFSVSSFQAYENTISHMKQIKQRNILITIGSDVEGVSPAIKVWNLDQTDKNKIPLCVKTIKITQENRSYNVACWAILENLSQLAVALENGTVILIRGDISRDRFTKQKVLHRGDQPVTGLGFKEQGKNVYLFVVTTNSVECYVTQGRESHEKLDDQGCDLLRVCMSDPEQEIILARKEAVWFYGPEGRGSCSVIEGEKKMISWFRGYLIVVGLDPLKAASSNSLQKVSRANTVTVYDTKNKFVAFSATFEDVIHVVSEWGSVFVITGDKLMYQLEEKDTSTKLDMLFKKNLYPMAINVASNAQYDYTSIIEIYRKYADHLYAKGDYDNAMTQYLKTIGKLEPSYVIRKYLDAQRIHNLTNYLQDLHEKGLANADHTTLLLNCYTKLKDNEKLDQFIKTDKNLNFDVETAIKVCRQASYHEYALYLAEKFQQHELYLKIQLEDIGNYNDAIDYISRLEFQEAEKTLIAYGKTLVNNVPEATRKLLEQLCTDYVPKSTTSANVSVPVDNSEEHKSEYPVEFSTKKKLKSKPERFIHTFVNQPTSLILFIESMISKEPDSSPILYDTLLELYLKEAVSGSQEFKTKAIELLKDPNSKVSFDNALVLCKMHDFKPGVLLVYERNKHFSEIVQYYMDNNEYTNILNVCKKQSDPNLVIQVLSYFASKTDDCSTQIKEMLSLIEKKELIPPLQVLQILSKNPSINLALVKSYIVKRIDKENESTLEDQKQIQKLQEETKKTREEIRDLKTGAKIFQSMRCAICLNALELPAYHFLCMHSFHQRCMGDNEKECPVCAPGNQALLERKRAQEQSANQHEQFFKSLEGSSNGFSVISEYFGRNIFNKVVLISEPTPVVKPKLK